MRSYSFCLIDSFPMVYHKSTQRCAPHCGRRPGAIWPHCLRCVPLAEPQRAREPGGGACNMQHLYIERSRAAARRRSDTCSAACGDDTAAAAKTTGRVRRRCALVQEALAALPAGHILVATDCDGPAAGAHPCEYSQGPSSTLSGSEPGTGPASAAALEPRGAEGRQARTNAYSGGFVRHRGFAGGEG